MLLNDTIEVIKRAKREREDVGAHWTEQHIEAYQSQIDKDMVEYRSLKEDIETAIKIVEKSSKGQFIKIERPFLSDPIAT